MRTTIIREISAQIGRLHRSLAGDQTHGEELSRDALKRLAGMLPSGSGINCGTTIDYPLSTENKIVLLTSFHHMDDVGMYDGWTEHKLTITPTFTGFNIAITGRNRNDIKDYLCDVYSASLRTEIEQPDDGSYLAGECTQSATQRGEDTSVMHPETM